MSSSRQTLHGFNFSPLGEGAIVIFFRYIIISRAWRWERDPCWGSTRALRVPYRIAIWLAVPLSGKESSQHICVIAGIEQVKTSECSFGKDKKVVKP